MKLKSSFIRLSILSICFLLFLTLSLPAASAMDSQGKSILDASFHAYLPNAQDPGVRTGISDLVYSTFLGGSGDQRGYAIVVDSYGYTYITGCTDSSDFPTTSGSFDETFNGGDNDAFLVKLSPNGSTLVYATFLGGSGKDCYTDYAYEDFQDYNNNIFVDSYGFVYITGYTNSTNFPTPSGYDGSYNGGTSDAYVVKFSVDGTALVYGTFLGGTGNDRGNGIAVSSGGAAYITGETSSTNFPITSGAFDETYNGGLSDGFAVKLSAGGTTVAFGTYLGGNGDDRGNGISVDSAGATYIAGVTSSTNFPKTSGAFDETYNGGLSDGFTLKLAANGATLAYGTFIGGIGDDRVNDIDISSTGAAFLTGDTKSSNFPTTPGAYQTVYNGIYHDAFILKMNQTGTAPVFSTFLGGNNHDYAYSVAVNTSGEALISGQTYSNDFPTTWWGYDTIYNGLGDIYVVKLSSTGSSLKYGSYFGGVGNDTSNGISLATSGILYLTGSANSSNFPITPGAFDTSYNINDGFVVKLIPSNAPIPVKKPFISMGYYDGWILESGESTSVGGSLDSTSGFLNIGDGNQDQQYRTILCFNTGALPDTAVIKEVKLIIKKNGVVGSNPFNVLGNLRVDIRKPYFGSAVSLAVTDFQATPNKSFVGAFGAVPVSDWYTAVLGSAAYPYINLKGTTQFRLYFAKDDNDDQGADYIKFYSGNYSITTVRPILTIIYYVP